jgi:hypothetical protein
MSRRSLGSCLGLGAVFGAISLVWASPVARCESRPFFVASVLSDDGETTIILSDGAATPVPMPAVFTGWKCYIGDTERLGPSFVKKVTCGGPWGFVDTFVTCGPKHRIGEAVLRLRQPIAGTKEEADAAEKLTLSAACAYDKK